MEPQVSIKCERSDFIEAMLHLNRKAFLSPGKGKGAKARGARELGFVVLLALLWGAIVIAVQLLLPCWRIDLLTVLLTGVLLLSALVVILKARNRMLGKTLREDGIYLRPQTFTVGEDALRIETPLSSSVLQWPAIFGVEATKTMLYIFVDGATALFVPTRFFPGKEEEERFVEAIRRRIGQKPEQGGVSA